MLVFQVCIALGNEALALVDLIPEALGLWSSGKHGVLWVLQVRFGWGWGAAHSLTQCVEVHTMAWLVGRADSSIWPLTPASGLARTEGGPLGTPGPVPSRRDAQWSCDKTGFEGEVDWWKQDIFKFKEETEGCHSCCDSRAPGSQGSEGAWTWGQQRGLGTNRGPHDCLSRKNEDLGVRRRVWPSTTFKNSNHPQNSQCENKFKCNHVGIP